MIDEGVRRVIQEIKRGTFRHGRGGHEAEDMMLVIPVFSAYDIRHSTEDNVYNPLKNSILWAFSFDVHRADGHGCRGSNH